MKHYKAVNKYRVTELHKYIPVSYDFFGSLRNVPKFDVLDPDTGYYRYVVLVEKCKASEGGEKIKITDNIVIHYDPS